MYNKQRYGNKRTVLNKSQLNSNARFQDNTADNIQFRWSIYF